MMLLHVTIKLESLIYTNLDGKAKAYPEKASLPTRLFSLFFRQLSIIIQMTIERKLALTI